MPTTVYERFGSPDGRFVNPVDGAGSSFTYTYVVTNNSVEAVTLTSVIDDVIGAITLPADVILAPGESSAPMTGTWTYTDAGIYPNTVTAVAVDNEGNSDTATASASVIVTDTPPVVELDKSVTPGSLVEPGGAFTFTLTITNNGVEPFTITSLTDTNLSMPYPAEVAALIGQVVPVGGSVSASYPISHAEAGVYPNDAEVIVADNEGTPDSDTASASVTVTDVLPTMTVTKVADPASRPEPGGQFGYTITVASRACARL